MFTGQKIPFTKMQGLGNDFVIIDNRQGLYHFTLEERQRISDRCTGIGCDQLIFIQQPTASDADIYMDMYNTDGTPLEACGNATRCVTKWMGQPHLRIQTVATILDCLLCEDGIVTANMGKISTDWKAMPMAEDYPWDALPDFGDGLPQGYVASIGNPHLVFVVDDVMAVDLEGLGKKLEHHSLFPNRINVEFVQVIDDKTARMRVWERGVGVTRACGSGATATGFVLTQKQFVPSSSVTIQMDGGRLEITNTPEGMLMTGPATFVFEGEYDYTEAAEINKRKTA